MLTLSQVSQYVASQAHKVIDTIGKMGTRTFKVIQSPNDANFGVGPNMFDDLFKILFVSALTLGAAAAAATIGVGYFAAGGALGTPFGIAMAASLTVGGVIASVVLANIFFKTKKEQ